LKKIMENPHKGSFRRSQASMTMPELCERLTAELGASVIDLMTGLTGKYDVVLETSTGIPMSRMSPSSTLSPSSASGWNRVKCPWRRSS
jgi:uncharacterized protein (TIGR03435 family)